MRTPWGFILLACALGAPGAFSFAFGIYKLIDLRQFLSEARVTSGRVTGMRLLGTGDDTSTYEMTVIYPAPDGSSRTFRVKTSGSYSTDDRVEVLYSSADARVRGINTTWSTPIIMTIAGLAWSAFAVLLIVVAVRAPRAQPPSYPGTTSGKAG